jgi:hypothetical protein
MCAVNDSSIIPQRKEFGMLTKISLAATALCICVVLLSPVLVFADEVTKDELADAIETYVKKESGLKGGYFLVFDQHAKSPLVLTLDKVHRARLAKIGKNVYFACADFATPRGKLYDLDIFMKGKNKESLVVTEISVHKEDGKERYTWFEKDGTWHKKPLKGEGSEEHPKEHPKEHPQEHPKDEG